MIDTPCIVPWNTQYVEVIHDGKVVGFTGNHIYASELCREGGDGWSWSFCPETYLRGKTWLGNGPGALTPRIGLMKDNHTKRR